MLVPWSQVWVSQFVPGALADARAALGATSTTSRRWQAGGVSDELFPLGTHLAEGGENAAQSSNGPLHIGSILRATPSQPSPV